ncbi:hypothetical protein COT48_05960, partial [Candidatus Woesearchaeota archaeon CG08_land_8_20_14_0_20_47_9]
YAVKDETSLTPLTSTKEEYLFGNTSAVANAASSSIALPYYTNRYLSAQTYYLSAYIFDNTSGSQGGQVSATVAKLYYNGTTLATSYEDEGGGWWRLGVGLNATAKNASYGVLVMPGKSVVIEGVQVERTDLPKSTSYCDGSLGAGYTWKGTNHNSNSTRSAGSVSYPTYNNFGVLNFSVSFWIKPKVDFRVAASSEATYTFFRSAVSASDIFRMHIGGSGTTKYLTGELLPAGTRPSAYFAINSDWEGQWHHIAFTYDNESNATIYLDGVRKDSTNIRDLLEISLINSYISMGWGYSYSDAVISDIRTFNGSLTDAQVRKLYYSSLQPQSHAPTLFEAKQEFTASNLSLLNTTDGYCRAVSSSNPVLMNGNASIYFNITSNESASRVWLEGYTDAARTNKVLDTNLTLESGSLTEGVWKAFFATNSSFGATLYYRMNVLTESAFASHYDGSLAVNKLPEAGYAYILSDSPDGLRVYKNSTLSCLNSTTADDNNNNIGIIYRWLVNDHELAFAKLSGTASASSSDVSHAAADAYDGSTASYWATAASTPATAWWGLDLGSIKNISGVRYLFTGSNADDHDVQYSSDGSTYINITGANAELATCNNGNLWHGLAFAQVEARYVRFYFRNPNSDSALGSLAEVEVYANSYRLNSSNFTTGDRISCIATLTDGLQNGSMLHAASRRFVITDFRGGKNISTTATSSAVTLAVVASYSSQGWWYSPVYDYGDNPSLGNLSYNATTPENTSVRLQIRTGTTDKLLYSDGFNSYGNGSIPTSWVSTSGSLIADNKKLASIGQAYLANRSWDDFSVEGKVIINSSASIIARYRNTSNYYVAILNRSSGVASIGKLIAGSYTQLATLNYEFTNATYHVKLLANSSSLKLKFWSLNEPDWMLTVAPSELDSGSISFRSSGSSIDEIMVYDLALNESYEDWSSWNGMDAFASDSLLSLRFNENTNGEAGETAAGSSGISYSDGVFGKGLLINESDSLTYATSGNINQNAGVIDLYIKPRWSGDDASVNWLFDCAQSETANRIIIAKGYTSYGMLSFVVRDSIDNDHELMYNISSWKADEWHHIAASWNTSTDTMRLYVDHQLKANLTASFDISGLP